MHLVKKFSAPMMGILLVIALLLETGAGLEQPHFTKALDMQNDSDLKVLNTFADGSQEKNVTFDRPNQQFEWKAESSLEFDTPGGKTIPVVDIDKDGLNEVLLANASSADSFVRVFRNFTTVADLVYTGRFNDIAVGDCDNDGVNEILIATSSGQVFIYGSNYMLKNTISIAGSNIGGVTVGDPDCDGTNEVVLADYTNGLARIFESSGSSYVGTFSLTFGLAWDVKTDYLVHGVTSGPGNSLVIQGGGRAKAFLFWDGTFHETGGTLQTDASKRPNAEANMIIKDVTNAGENKLVMGKNVYGPCGSVVSGFGLQLICSLPVSDPTAQVKSIAAGYVPEMGNVIAIGTSVSFEIHWRDGSCFRRVYEEYVNSSGKYGCDGVGIGDPDNDGEVEILAYRNFDRRYVMYSLSQSHYAETTNVRMPQKSVVESARLELVGHKSERILVENFGMLLGGASLWFGGIEQRFRVKEQLDVDGAELHLQLGQWNASYAEAELRPLHVKANTTEMVNEDRWYKVIFPSASTLTPEQDYSLFLSRSSNDSNIFWYLTWRIGYHYKLFEEKYPTNPRLHVAGTMTSDEWSHVGECNESSPENANINASLINDYLRTVPSDAEGNVLVPLLFESDSAGQLEVSRIEILYRVDTLSPVTTNDYDGLWRNADFTVTLATTDNISGVAGTYFRINDGPIQNLGANGQPQITTESANNTLEYWSVDKVANEELPHRILTGIKLDKTSPTGSVMINDGDTCTTSTSVTLTLTANDALSGIYQARFSNDGVWDTEPWEDFSATKTWLITSGDGTKTVYCQIDDNAGLVSTTYSNTIMLDTTPPTGSAAIAQGANCTNSTSATLTLSADDATSGISQMRFSNDNITWTPWEPYSTSKTWALTTGDGTKTIYAQYIDKAGLTSPAYQDTILLDTTKPVANAGQDQTVNVGTKATFDANASIDNVGIISYEWNFGDGTTGTGITTTHIYTNLGTYVVTLTVRDAAGNSGTNSINVAVSSTEGFPMWAVGVTIAAIAIVAAATALFWKKRKLRTAKE